MSDWKYDIDEVGDDGADSDREVGDDADSGDEVGVAETDEGERPAPAPVEPGSPTAENAFFVALGVATTLFVFARVVMLVG